MPPVSRECRRGRRLRLGGRLANPSPSRAEPARQTPVLDRCSVGSPPPLTAAPQGPGPCCSPFPRAQNAGGLLQQPAALQQLPCWVSPAWLCPPKPPRAANLPGLESERGLHGHLGSLLPPRVPNLVFAERCHQCLQSLSHPSPLCLASEICVCGGFFCWVFFSFKGLFFFSPPSGCVRAVAWRQASYSSLSFSVPISSLSFIHTTKP